MKNIYFWMLSVFCCTLTFAQLTEGFESDPLTGWSFYSTESDDPGFIRTDVQAYSGSYSYFHDDDNLATSSSSFMISPQYTVASGDELSVYLYQNYSAIYYEYSGILVSTSSSDPIANPSDFTEIFEAGSGFAEDEWTQVTLPLDDYVGQDIYIAFKYTGDYAHELYIDNLYVGAPCDAPTATLTATPDCANFEFSVEIEVTDLGTASSVLIGDDQGNTQTISSTGTYTFGPYASGTEVNFDITDENNEFCSIVDSASYICPPPNDDCSGATEISSFPYTLTQDATGATQTDFITCSNEVFNDGVWFTFEGESAQYTVNLTSYGFDAAIGVFSGSCDNLSCVIADDAAGTDEQETLEFVGQVGVTYYIVLGNRNGSFDREEGEFDIEVLSEDIPCSAPTNLAVSTVTDLSADVSWTLNTENTSYDLVWGEAGFTPGAEASAYNISDSPYTITGLTPETEYDLYIRGNCDPGLSEWVGLVSFTTLEEGIILPGTDCAHPITITSLPYSTTDDTANYGDDYESGQGTNCGSDSQYYLSGDDVVYAYTATSDSSIDIEMTPTATWSGIFVYENCADIGEVCAVGVANTGSSPRIIEDFMVTEGQTYYIVISTWNAPQSTEYVLEITENTCIPVEYTISYIDDCDNGEFSVSLDVTSLGSAPSVTFTDDQSNEEIITEPGILTFGPYSVDSEISLTITTDDVNCNEVETLSYACPATNDNCSTAIELTLGSTFDENVIIANNVGATDSGVDTPSCGSYSGGDVWFSVVVPESGTIKVETANAGDESLTDTVVSVYTGTCDAGLVEIACNDDAEIGFYYSFLEIDDVTPGEIVYIRVWDYASNEEGTFQISAYDDNTCIDPDYVVTTTTQCLTAAVYTVTYEFTDLGSANSIILTDDQGSSAVTVDAPGTYEFGPYVEGTEVIISAVTGDENCDFSETFLAYCPPSNDECDTAIEVAVETGVTEPTQFVEGSILGATDSGIGPQSCDGWTGTPNDDVWYSFEATSENMNITVDDNFDGVVELFEGVCGDLVHLTCADITPEIEATGLTIGNTYYVRVFGYGSSTPTDPTFTIAIWSSTLGVTDIVGHDKVQLYPNPTTDILHISGVELQDIKVFSTSGKRVDVFIHNGQVDTRNLPTGTYFMRMTDEEGNVILRKFIKK